jgi:hypothetical protein
LGDGLRESFARSETAHDLSPQALRFRNRVGRQSRRLSGSTPDQGNQEQRSVRPCATTAHALGIAPRRNAGDHRTQRLNTLSACRTKCSNSLRRSAICFGHRRELRLSVRMLARQMRCPTHQCWCRQRAQTGDDSDGETSEIQNSSVDVRASPL